MVLILIASLQPLFKLFCSVPLKLADQVCGYRDRSSTLRGLRFLEVPSTTFSVEQHRAQDCDCTLVKIDIFPLQPEVFFRTHPGPKSDPEYETVLPFGRNRPSVPVARVRRFC